MIPNSTSAQCTFFWKVHVPAVSFCWSLHYTPMAALLTVFCFLMQVEIMLSIQ